MLGITPGTLRRWADDGRVPVFTTPGGHRRFSSTAITALLPADRARRPTLARLGATPERIARAYRRIRPAGPPAPAPWIEALSAEHRDVFRDRGRELVTILLDHLDAADPETAADRLQEAKQLAAAYGREVAGLGLSLADAVEGFLRFRSPFTDALGGFARRRGLDTREATSLLAQAEAATDALLVAVMTGHSLAIGERSAAHRRPGPRAAR
jgi:DNA-binding transcriptional MerR regulator